MNLEIHSKLCYIDLLFIIIRKLVVITAMYHWFCNISKKNVL